MKVKICTKCKIKKQTTEFSKRNSSKIGYASQCKKCLSLSRKNIKRTKEGLCYSVFFEQKQRSIIRNHPSPTYTKQELKEWMLSQPNFETLYNNWVDSCYDKNLVPSIDRKNDYKGYSFDNIQLMTWGENLQKNYNDMKNGINNKLSKSVDQFDLKGNYINTFHSTRDAIRKTGVVHISEVCNNKRPIAGGYFWKFKD